ncbi:FAD-dependent tricarballylate dehydrogenase TcuA [Amycolatopsis methanolica]|uniref:Dehydrogenase n=1 Tax=Amycolatopsis methanolica 239 TaxID=1068978 RepID=A0A076MM18_AMYME|nr:FAD-dependent tricarballylate dehydrogenase TcuA [Amycolatopsis methanolica]AIJ21898.1 dehydrogenase [Amycolatopsis methanolica 239]
MTTSASSLDPVVVIGAGIAGLSAAVSAAEQGAPVVLVDRAGPLEAGGNTKWTSAYLRLDDVYEPSESFVEEVVAFSGGRTPSWYVEALVEHLPETMEWIQGHGARFRRFPTYFINSNRPRLQPHGGGEALLTALRPVAERLGVEFRYHTTAQSLVTAADGRVAGVRVSDPDGDHVLPARAVVIASGGFEGDPATLGKELRGDVSTLIPIAPGVAFNKGEGIRMALDAGAKRGGQWDSFHAEPVDPRADNPEALVMVFPYGILVNKLGERFLDEGRGTVDETYESTARAVWSQPDGTAYFITDRKFEQVTDRERGLLTSCKPITADTLDDLAAALDLPAGRLTETVTAYNKSVVDGEFNWRRPDGKRTNGLTPPKSNWALPIDEAPLLAYPVGCAIVFTFGGLETDADARVVDEQGAPIPGLYAAGECTGIYHDKYPGGTSVLRGMVFGRVAGRAAAA